MRLLLQSLGILLSATLAGPVHGGCRYHEVSPTIKALKEDARRAGLIYGTPEDLDIRRVKKGKSFSYVDTEGKAVKDPETLERIRKLGIPPAYKNVRIASNPKLHLQYTGEDAKGRTQYRYALQWAEARADHKFQKMIAVGKALPKIRESISSQLRKKGTDKARVLAAVVRLLDLTSIRVGNEEYVKANHSYGLTTLERKHIEIKGANFTLRFQGKEGIRHQAEVKDSKLTKAVKEILSLKGSHIFQFTNEKGEISPLTSEMVDGYLTAVSGVGMTAKDFRTWAATTRAVEELSQSSPPEDPKAVEKNIQKALEAVAERLGNTPEISKKSYVYPKVLELYRKNALEKFFQKAKTHPLPGLSRGETAAWYVLHD